MSQKQRDVLLYVVFSILGVAMFIISMLLGTSRW